MGQQSSSMGQQTPCIPKVPLRVATWNVAGVNNNPFDFWMPSNANHTNLMKAFENELASERTVNEYFTQDMYNYLKDNIFGNVKENTISILDNTYETFGAMTLKDLSTNKDITKSRVFSYPDRATASIRPTAVDFDLSRGVAEWYKEWVSVMEEQGLNAIDKLNQGKNKRTTKYGDSYKFKSNEIDADVEIQLLSLAMLDTIFFKILSSIPNAQNIKADVIAALKNDKVSVVKNILDDLANASDIIFLQEVDAGKINLLTPTGFSSIVPKSIRSIPQDSVILYRTGLFSAATNIDHKFGDEEFKNESIAACLTLEKSKRDLIVVSYHSTSDGKDSTAVINALKKEGKPFILGIDANTSKNGLKVSDFTDHIEQNGFYCMSHFPTTRKARTFFQTQLTKGKPFKELKTEKGDQKDYIVASNRVLFLGVITGSTESNRLLPALDFPSDHYIVKGLVCM